MHHYKYYQLLFSILILFSGCTKSTDEIKTSWTPAVKIRGFEYRNEMGEKLADIGQPDIRLTYPDVLEYSQWEMALFCFPTPARTVMSVGIAIADTSESFRLWMVPATFEELGSYSSAYPPGAIISSINRPLLDTVIKPKGVTIHLHIHDIPTGYYRIYMKSQEILLWDNVVFENSK